MDETILDYINKQVNSWINELEIRNSRIRPVVKYQTDDVDNLIDLLDENNTIIVDNL